MKQSIIFISLAIIVVYAGLGSLAVYGTTSLYNQFSEEDKQLDASAQAIASAIILGVVGLLRFLVDRDLRNILMEKK